MGLDSLGNCACIALVLSIPGHMLPQATDEALPCWPKKVHVMI